MEREVHVRPTPPRRRLALSALTALLVAGFALPPAIARADALPDGRAYELVTPGLNGLNIAPGHQFFTQATASGDGLAFAATDAPDSASSSAVENALIATRGTTGWSVSNANVPFTMPESQFYGTFPEAISSDLSQLLVSTDQSLTPTAESGANLYVGSTGGSAYSLLTPASDGLATSGEFAAGVSADFSHVYFQPALKQLADDPVDYTSGQNLYQWTGGRLSIVNVMPNGALSSEGSSLAGGVVNNLPAMSADGGAVLFQDTSSSGTLSPLYLRVDGTSTRDVSASQRTSGSPGATQSPTAIGITADGSQVLFTSAMELTNDANTGSANSEAGNDLYDYNVSDHTLTDLTPDTNAADTAGADVQAVVGAADDASYVYFVATGDLAGKAVSGQSNLYVEHDGTITLLRRVAPDQRGGDTIAYTTPDGGHFVFQSRTALTGYDNVDQSTHRPDSEVYEYDATSGTLVCASCRTDGTAPTGSATIPYMSPGSDNLVTAPRVAGDDGSRVFFESTDQLVADAVGGVQGVYEYEGGQVYPVSPSGATQPATLVDASASGDDVFFDSYDDVIPPLNASLESAIWDARVGGGFPIATTEGVCTATVQCRGTGSGATGSPAIATDSPGGQLTTARRVILRAHLRSIDASAVTLRVRVNRAGRITASGKGVMSAHRRVHHASTVVLTLRLTRRARELYDRGRTLRLTVRVRDRLAGGRSLRTTVHVKAKKGAHR